MCRPLAGLFDASGESNFIQHGGSFVHLDPHTSRAPLYRPKLWENRGPHPRTLCLDPTWGLRDSSRLGFYYSMERPPEMNILLTLPR